MIISSLLILLDFIIGLLPLNLPSSGTSFQSALGVLETHLNDVISFIYTYVISYEVVQSIFTLLIIWVTAKVGYLLFFWVIHKLPLGIN